MTLNDWLAYLEKLHPSAVELGLQRVRPAAERLGLDFRGRKVVTVGGTNGKGYCVALLSRILMAAGYRTATYTSPHLLAYNERVCFDGRPVEDEELCVAFAEVERARGEIPLTYFEFGTLASLWLFSRRPLDCMLLEVGLGGRLDAVNIVDPDVAVVTNVALDHTDWLGDTREAIGREKAGIFRPGKPAVYGERDVPNSVSRHAKAIGAHLYRLGQEFDWHWCPDSRHWNWRSTGGPAGGNLGEDGPAGRSLSEGGPALRSLSEGGPALRSLSEGGPALRSFSEGGPALRSLSEGGLPADNFNLDNAACVVQAASLLEPGIGREAVLAGLRTATVPGRFQVMELPAREHGIAGASPLFSAAGGAPLLEAAEPVAQGPTLVLDVAHNPHAAAELVHKLRRHFSGRAIHVVIAMLRDKDSTGVIAALNPVCRHWYAGQVDVERGLPAKILYNRLLESGAGAAQRFNSVSAAFSAARQAARPGDVIVVTGSFYTVADVLRLQGGCDPAR